MNHLHCIEGYSAYLVCWEVLHFEVLGKRDLQWKHQAVMQHMATQLGPRSRAPVISAPEHASTIHLTCHPVPSRRLSRSIQPRSMSRTVVDVSWLLILPPETKKSEGKTAAKVVARVVAGRQSSL
jgi:hypothetical protein